MARHVHRYFLHRPQTSLRLASLKMVPGGRAGSPRCLRVNIRLLQGLFGVDDVNFWRRARFLLNLVAQELDGAGMATRLLSLSTKIALNGT